MHIDNTIFWSALGTIGTIGAGVVAWKGLTRLMKNDEKEEITSAVALAIDVESLKRDLAVLQKNIENQELEDGTLTKSLVAIEKKIDAILPQIQHFQEFKSEIDGKQKEFIGLLNAVEHMKKDLEKVEGNHANINETLNSMYKSINKLETAVEVIKQSERFYELRRQ
jgi:chromosome segregation ATPase